MYENTSIPTPFLHHYETIPSSPVRSSPKSSIQQSVYVPFESNPPPRTAKPVLPSFQRKFPIVLAAILGFFELFAGLIVLILELLIFDIALGSWCGGIYALAGAAILVLVIASDRERHQISAVLIFQFVALMFTITEVLLHSESYRKRCITKPNEPTRELTFRCSIVIIQMAAAALVSVSAIGFAIIYFRVTMVALKQPYGTFNMSNAIQLTDC